VRVEDGWNWLKVVSVVGCVVLAMLSRRVLLSDSKMDLMEIFCEGGRRMELAQGHISCRLCSISCVEPSGFAIRSWILWKYFVRVEDESNWLRVVSIGRLWYKCR
jgi:hypothetical protein